jgi:hypothetical protein
MSRKELELPRQGGIRAIARCLKHLTKTDTREPQPHHFLAQLPSRSPGGPPLAKLRCPGISSVDARRSLRCIAPHAPLSLPPEMPYFVVIAHPACPKWRWPMGRCQPLIETQLFSPLRHHPVNLRSRPSHFLFRIVRPFGPHKCASPRTLRWASSCLRGVRGNVRLACTFPKTHLVYSNSLKR